MAFLVIETPTTLGAYSFQAELDGAVFNFAFQFNDREGYWYFSYSDESGVAIRSGIKVTSNWATNRLVVDERDMPGLLLVVEPTDADFDPGLEDLGDSVLLTYADESELP